MTNQKSGSRQSGKTADPELETPARHFPNSRANRIAVLDIGESDSMAIRHNLDEVTKVEIEGSTASLRSAMSKAADTATKRTANKYVTETGTIFTRTGDIIVTAVVTRIS